VPGKRLQSVARWVSTTIQLITCLQEFFVVKDLDSLLFLVKEGVPRD